MPYIKQEDRDKHIGLTLAMEKSSIDSAGELNYLITTLVREYFVCHGLSYQRLNDVIGALEAAKLELYRRIAGPYEDKKIDENGDLPR